jgi:hypothetical protein
LRRLRPAPHEHAGFGVPSRSLGAGSLHGAAEGFGRRAQGEVGDAIFDDDGRRSAGGGVAQREAVDVDAGEDKSGASVAGGSEENEERQKQERFFIGMSRRIVSSTSGPMLPNQSSLSHTQSPLVSPVSPSLSPRERSRERDRDRGCDHSSQQDAS